MNLTLNKLLYFSYGSNMSMKRLRDRVPSARPVGMAVLPGHELRFHKKGKDDSGKCDAFITGRHEHAVVGVLYEMDASEKPCLDRKEGLGDGYEEKTVEVTVPSGQTVEAITYYATQTDPALKPYAWYKHHVLTGALENGLPDGYIERIHHVESIRDPDARRHQREMAIYANLSLPG